MELMKRIDLDKREKAKKRVEELKGFYAHLAVYLVVCTFVSVNKIVRNLYNGESFNEAFWDFGTFLIWIFWGIGVVFHARKAFRYNIFFGKEWEERKIKEFMNKEQQNRQE